MGLFQAMTMAERFRRKALVEALLKEGYSPLNMQVGRGSALEQADRVDGRASGTYASWVRKETKKANKGKAAILPDWRFFVMPQETAMPPTATVETEVQANPDARADCLRAEITRFVTGTNFPLINPDCISVTTAYTRRFDAKAGSYKSVPSTPKTWLNDTPRAAPITEAAGRRFLFTCAQNDADLHRPFWDNLVAYAAEIGAEIVVGPSTYETSWWSENSTTARSYPKAVEPHLCFGQLAIGDHVVFAGEMNVLATASQPVTDLVTYGRNRWTIVPHGKRQLKSVPSTDPERQAVQVMTTGCCTRPKLVPRKAGLKSLFHNAIGAVILEIDAIGRVFLRQITAAEDGSFYDLTRRVKDGIVTGDHRVKAITYGDVHLRKLDPLNSLGAFGFAPGLAARNRHSMLDALKPEHVLLHDVFDHEARNHHRADDFLHLHEMAIRDRDSVIGEVLEVGEFLASFKDKGARTIVVESNHDIALDRWVREGRYRLDGTNIAWGHQLAMMMLDNRSEIAWAKDRGLPAPKFSLIEKVLRDNDAEQVDHVEWAYDGGSMLIDGIEVGHHGFRGANGARGSTIGYARMGRKMTVGDRHSPEIHEGVYTAGTMTLQQGYNKGPSGWAVSHVVQYADGHRVLITMQDGAWCAMKPRISIIR